MFMRKSFSSQDRCYPLETVPLPEGIIAKTSNLEMQPLWGAAKKSVHVTS